MCRYADYILKDGPNLIKVFLYAPSEYCSIGNEKVVNFICDYINEKNK